MKKFTLIIKDNETGETVIEQDTKAILCSCEADDSFYKMSLIGDWCTNEEVGSVCEGVEGLLNKIYDEAPFVKTLVTMNQYGRKFLKLEPRSDEE